MFARLLVLSAQIPISQRLIIPMQFRPGLHQTFRLRRDKFDRDTTLQIISGVEIALNAAVRPTTLKCFQVEARPVYHST